MVFVLAWCLDRILNPASIWFNMLFSHQPATVFLVFVLTLASPFRVDALGHYVGRDGNTDQIIVLPIQSFAEQVKIENSVYEIKDDFDLHGESIIIPNGCVLSFNGGIIRNGVLIGNKTIINSVDASPIFTNVILEGTWKVGRGYPEWFGAIGDGISNDRMAVQTAFNVCDTVVLNNNYLIHNAPFNYRRYNPIPDDELEYYLDVLSQKNNCPNSLLTPLTLSSNKTVVVSGTIRAYSPLGILIKLEGNNSHITGGGTISGCGIVNTVNVYSGEKEYPIKNWESALIYIKGSYNKVDSLTIKDPTRQGISIDDYLSHNNVISNNIIGGGLKSHTKTVETCNFTGLFGIYARGTNTVVRDNVFKRIDGRTVYSALYCNYTTTNVPRIDKRTEVHTVFDNNIVEDALEHAVYSYATNLRIIRNTIRSDFTALQLFNGNQFVDSNTIYCNSGSLGIYVSGEGQIITNNKLYNVGRYGIRCAGYYNGSCDNDYVANNYIEKAMVPFSETDPKTTPAISFESVAFENNRLHLNRITCENNTVKCVGESKSARTTPIVGIIAVYADKNSRIDQINILNNTVLNSNVADNIVITLLNEVNNGTAIIEGNTCINNCSIISTTPGEPVLSIQGVETAIVRKNHLEQQGKTGTAFRMTNVGKAVLTDNTLIADLYSRSIFFSTNNSLIDIDGSNIINGLATERIVTIPAKTTLATKLDFCLPEDHWDLEITPVNRAARKAERNNALKILKSSNQGVQLSHDNPTAEPTQYRVKVVYR